MITCLMTCIAHAFLCLLPPLAHRSGEATQFTQSHSQPKDTYHTGILTYGYVYAYVYVYVYGHMSSLSCSRVLCLLEHLL